MNPNFYFGECVSKVIVNFFKERSQELIYWWSKWVLVVSDSLRLYDCRLPGSSVWEIL